MENDESFSSEMRSKTRLTTLVTFIYIVLEVLVTTFREEKGTKLM